MRDDEFELNAQPVVAVGDGEPASYELLLRLREGGDLLPPAAFLPSAERHGLSRDIDRWVVHHAHRWVAARDERRRSR